MNKKDTAGPRYWKSLDDLADTPAFREWMERDPIKLFEAQLELAKVLSAEEAQAVHDEIQAEVDEAIEFAEASPMPDPATDMLTDVYTEAS